MTIPDRIDPPAGDVPAELPVANNLPDLSNATAELPPDDLPDLSVPMIVEFCPVR